MVFEKTLKDIIRSLKSASKSNELTLCNLFLTEAFKEISSTNSQAIKAEAVKKMKLLFTLFNTDASTFLFSLLSTSSANASSNSSSNIAHACEISILELQSSPNIRWKIVGYVIATGLVSSDSPALTLATNTLCKDLALTADISVISLALNGLAWMICNNNHGDGNGNGDDESDIAKAVYDHVFGLVDHFDGQIALKALVALFKIGGNGVLSWKASAHDTLSLTVPKAVSKIGVAESGITFSSLKVSQISTIIQLLTEWTVASISSLSSSSPSSQPPLSSKIASTIAMAIPILYEYLKNPASNWIIIKIVRLLGLLCSIETRLVKKLKEPIGNLLHTTTAISVLFECLTVIFGPLSQYSDLVDSGIKLLQEKYLKADDGNLRFLGMQLLETLMKSKVTIDCCDNFLSILMSFLTLNDVTLKFKAVELIPFVIRKLTFQQTITSLISIHSSLPVSSSHHIASLSHVPLFSAKIIECIAKCCFADCYTHVSDFAFLLHVVFDLFAYRPAAHPEQLMRIVCDLAVRSPSLRAYICTQLRKLLEKQKETLDGLSVAELNDRGIWILGEYLTTNDEVNIENVTWLMDRILNIGPNECNSLTIFKLFPYYDNIGKLIPLLKKYSQPQSDLITASLFQLVSIMSEDDHEYNNSTYQTVIQIVTTMKKEKEIKPVSPNAQSLIKPSFDIDKPFHPEIDFTLITHDIFAVKESFADIIITQPIIDASILNPEKTAKSKLYLLEHSVEDTWKNLDDVPVKKINVASFRSTFKDELIPKNIQLLPDSIPIDGAAMMKESSSAETMNSGTVADSGSKKKKKRKPRTVEIVRDHVN